MQWFDAIFRAIGPLLPLIPWALRCTSCLSVMDANSTTTSQWPLGTEDQPRGIQFTAQESSSVSGSHLEQHPSRRIGLVSTLPLSCLTAYIAIGAVRLGLYLLHIAVQRRGGAGGSFATPLMSDHIFLAASVVSCLQSEMICSLSDIIKLELLGSGEIRP